MNKGIIIVGGLLLAIIVGGVFTIAQDSQQQDKTKMAQEEVAIVSEDEAMEGEDEMMKKDEEAMEDDKMMRDEMSDSRYIKYSKTVLDKAMGGRRVLYFYANWCPVCRPADIDFKENMQKIPEDTVVIRVNYSDSDTDQEEKDLAAKYGITYQHTFVQIDKDGNVITLWNGGQLKELLLNIK